MLNYTVVMLVYLPPPQSTRIYAESIATDLRYMLGYRIGHVMLWYAYGLSAQVAVCLMIFTRLAYSILYVFI